MKKLIRRALNRTGYDIYALDRGLEWGTDPWRDMLRIYPPGHRPVVFDVGANVGQTASKCDEFLDSPTMYCFEPDSDAFAELSARFGNNANFNLFRMAIGSENGTAVLKRQSSSTMNSLLDPGDGWGQVKSTDEVQIRTLDSLCKEIGVDRIDILKIDAQGYDLEVARGAATMIRANRIRFILMEINLVPMYKCQADLDTVYRTMIDLGMRVQAVYKLVYINDQPTYTDVLFQNTQPSAL